jgi:hypothetical protein
MKNEPQGASYPLPVIASQLIPQLTSSIPGSLRRGTRVQNVTGTIYDVCYTSHRFQYHQLSASGLKVYES